MSAVLEMMQSAAAKLPPATCRTQSYKSSNTGQSNAANKYNTVTISGKFTNEYRYHEELANLRDSRGLTTMPPPRPQIYLSIYPHLLLNRFNCK